MKDTNQKYTDTRGKELFSSADNQPEEVYDPLTRAQQCVSQLATFLAPLVSHFDAEGEKLYLVGGSVRDAILGRLGHDLDFATSARPELVHSILSAWTPAVWDTGIAFGTVSAEKDGQQIEITTFRSDSYDGSSRNPAVRFGDTLEGDLVRRDFRVNAMALELLPSGDYVFHDPMGGMSDMLAGRLDTPSAPSLSFHDDPLRMLRAARFSAQLGFDVAPRVREAMSAMAAEIQRITPERVRYELDRLMLTDQPWVGIDLLVTTGIAEYVYPEIPALRLERDEHHQHKDVYAHSLTVLRQAMEQEEPRDSDTDSSGLLPAGPDLVLRWAALVHDVGKPSTRRFERGGVTFYHHDVAGAKLVRKRMRALKYSKQMIHDVSQLVYLHMRFYGYGESDWTDSAVRRYVTDAGPLLPRLNKLVRADCTTRNQRKAQRLHRALEELERRIADIAQQEDLARIRPDLDGNAIMRILNIPPGRDVGLAWNYLKDLRLERGPLDPQEAEALLLEWWEKHRAAQSQQS